MHNNNRKIIILIYIYIYMLKYNIKYNGIGGSQLKDPKDDALLILDVDDTISYPPVVSIPKNVTKYIKTKNFTRNL